MGGAHRSGDTMPAVAALGTHITNVRGAWMPFVRKFGDLQLRQGEKCCKGAPAGSSWDIVNIRRSSPCRTKTHG